MNTLKKEKGTFISKSEAVMLQSVAVMLMVWHHLFGFPDRIHVPYVLVLDYFYPIETYLAYFGRICIAIFAFSSGYGLRKRYLNNEKNVSFVKNYKTCLTQLVKFFSRYWAVFFVFIPLGLALGVYNWDWKQFINGIIGKGSSYNGEWWYTIYYIRILLLFPVLALVMDSLNKISHVINHCFIAVCLLVLTIVPTSIPLYSFWLVLMYFLEGMYFVDRNIYETIFQHIPNNKWCQFTLGVVLFSIVFLLRHIGIADYWLVPFMIFAVILMIKSLQLIQSVLMFIGKYSTYIWLTHTFFGYYMFQKLTFFPRYSWLVFLWCLMLSIVIGMILESLSRLIRKLKLFKH